MSTFSLKSYVAEMRSIRISRRYVRAFVLIFAALALYILAINRVLPLLLSISELSRIEQLSTNAGVLGSIDLVRDLLFWPFNQMALLTQQWLSPAYLTAGLGLLISVGMFIFYSSRYQLWQAALGSVLLVIHSGFASFLSGYHPELMIVGLLLLGASTLRLVQQQRAHSWVWVAATLVWAAFCGVIGFGLLVAFASVFGYYAWSRKQLERPQTRHLVAVITIISIVAGLIVFSVANGAQYNVFPDSGTGIKENAQNLGQLMLYGRADNAFLWAANWSLLSVAGVVLSVLGMRQLWLEREDVSSRFLLVSVLWGLIVPIIWGVSWLTMVLLAATAPILITEGFQYLNHQWNRRFPHSVPARKVKIIMLGLLALSLASMHVVRQLDYRPQLNEFRIQYVVEQSDSDPVQ